MKTKKLFLLGDFVINSLNFATNFINYIFSNGMISVINKPTRVTKKGHRA